MNMPTHTAEATCALIMQGSADDVHDQFNRAADMLYFHLRLVGYVAALRSQIECMQWDEKNADLLAMVIMLDDAMSSDWKEKAEAALDLVENTASAAFRSTKQYREVTS